MRSISTAGALQPVASVSGVDEPAPHGAVFRLGIYLLPVAALLSLAGLALALGRVPYPDRHYFFMDQNRYVAMAEHPFSLGPLVREPPFNWRLLAPLLVHLLPLPAPDGFWLLTVASLSAAALALVWFLRGVGLPPGASVAGALAFVTLAPLSGFDLWDYMLVDPLAVALVIVTLGCAVHRQGLFLLISLIALAATKEIAVLGAIFAVAWAAERRDWAMLRWAAAGLVASFAVIAAIRIAVPADRPYGLTAMYTTVYGASPSLSLIAHRLALATLEAWTVLLPFALLQLVHPPHAWRSPAFALLFIGAAAQVLVATDVARLIVYAAPVVIAACAFEVEYLAGRWQLSRWWLWGPLLAIQLAWWFGLYGKWYDPSKTAAVVPCLALTAVAAALVAWRVRDRIVPWLRPAPSQA